ncbi:diguanylate cyclase (GGDEF) domain-containing protein [Sulfurivirga caldicuralii]|uniref:diguanylate cyclase n=1 Tax=Sulfurivirga caldicuralii TaxID=364032 RepID=A0A1N6F5F1_9GAMM|nr:GGDEF domain-containing protein [Sulfurivirga caldicuralii]SIN90480.1 diguanylate cyclase (GGDEF) domain-containing protein [Sulfurivirga caldicuralii]
MERFLINTDSEGCLEVPQQLFDHLLNKTLLHLNEMLEQSGNLQELLTDILDFFREVLATDCAEIRLYVEERCLFHLSEGMPCDEEDDTRFEQIPPSLQLAQLDNDDVFECFPVQLDNTPAHLVLRAHNVDANIFRAVKAILAAMAPLVEKVIREKHILYQLQEAYRAISSHALFLRIDSTCHIDQVSEALAQLLQRDADAMLGKPLEAVLGEKPAEILCSGCDDPLTIHVEANNQSLALRATRIAIKDEMGDPYTLFVYEDITALVEAERLALHDPLTGLYNRIMFDEIIQRELRYNLRYKRLTAFVILDLDHFKAFNDTLGHQAGDAVLKAFVDGLSQTFARPHDFLFRLGGEEFALLFSSSKVEHIHKQIQRLFTHFEAHPIDHPANPPWNRLTFSAGAVVVPPHCANTIDTAHLYQHADSLLYAAKHAGRNTYRLETLDCSAENSADDL